MLNPTIGFPAFAYISHKVLRWFAPIFLISAFVANSFLLLYPFYWSLFILQILFYSGALAGRVLSRSHVKIRFFGMPYYFVSMNIALLLGFFRFCTNSQSVAAVRDGSL